MKRKILSLLIIFVMMTAVLSQSMFYVTAMAASSQENSLESPYLSVISRVIQNNPNSFSKAYGALYDIDGNGVQELLMVYSAKLDMYTAKVCSVYTILDGEAIALMDSEELFPEVGGPSGHIAVLESDGTTYFAITSESGGTGGFDDEPILRGGTWRLYTLQGTSMQLQQEITYDAAVIYGFSTDARGVSYEQSSAMINGRSCGYEEYEAWENSLNELLRIDAYDDQDAMQLEELIDYLQENPTDGNEVRNGMVAYADNNELCIRLGSTITLSVDILVDGELEPDLSEVNFQIEDTNVLSIVSKNFQDGHLYVKFRGISEGVTKVVFNDSNTGYGIRIPITVYDDSYCFYTLNSVPLQYIEKYPTNFYNLCGMFVDNYSYSVNDDQSAVVSFDVYNTNYIYGMVEVLYENGDLKQAVLIDKMHVSGTNLKEAILDNGGYIIRDIFQGDIGTYRQESGYSICTPICVTVPKNGYVKITMDPYSSMLLSVVNGVDFMVNIVDAGKDFKKIESKSKEFSQTLTQKLVESKSFSALCNDGAQMSKQFWKDYQGKIGSSFVKETGKGVYKEILVDFEMAENFTKTIIKNIKDLELSEIILSAAGSCGLNITEQAFIDFTGPVGDGLAVMFGIGKAANLIYQQADLTNRCGDGSIYIQNQGGGTRSCQQVKVESDTTFSDDTALGVFKVNLDSEILNKVKEFSPKIYEAFTNGVVHTYNISLLKDGAETQPDSKVTVYLPIPEDLKSIALSYLGDFSNKIKIYRIEEDGSMTEMDTEIREGCFVFTTDHFSLYTIVGYHFEQNTVQPKVEISIPLILGVVVVMTIVGGAVAILIVKKKENSYKW